MKLVHSYARQIERMGSVGRVLARSLAIVYVSLKCLLLLDENIIFGFCEVCMCRKHAWELDAVCIVLLVNTNTATVPILETLDTKSFEFLPRMGT